jgi:hypothetical protein
MKFKIGDIVVSAVNHAERGMITGIVTRLRGHQYLVTWSDHCETFHYEMELIPKSEAVTTGED